MRVVPHIYACPNSVALCDANRSKHMQVELIEFGQVQKLQECGIHYPNTKHQLEWMFRRRYENGLADAFAVINGRKVFKPRKYLELVGDAQ